MLPASFAGYAARKLNMELYWQSVQRVQMIRSAKKPVHDRMYRFLMYEKEGGFYEYHGMDQTVR